MSVPPRSTLTVRRRSLPGTRYVFDCQSLREECVAALRTHGAEAALELIERHTERPSRTAIGLPSSADLEERFAEQMSEALRAAGVPDCIGVFLDDDADAAEAPSLGVAATLAVLARRSGPLYLPRRRFIASLIVPARGVLVFPSTQMFLDGFFTSR
jgi:hypothetical protein